MSVNQLASTYIDRIEIEDTEYVPIDDAVSDAACLTLTVPTVMLRDYSRLRALKRELPNGPKFWRDTRLGELLRNSDKYHDQGHEPLSDILDYLEGKVWVDYQRFRNLPEIIRMSVTEVPEFHDLNDLP